MGQSGASKIVKIDEDKRLVFGWASIIKDEGGRVLLDRQDDFIDSEDELEKAAYDFVLHSRDGGEMHVRRGVSKMVESVVMTPEKQQALGIAPGTVPVGWWVGFRVDDNRVWDEVKKGGYSGFSVHGTGQRQRAMLRAGEFTEVEKNDALIECPVCGDRVQSGERCSCGHIHKSGGCGCGCGNTVLVKTSEVVEYTRQQKVAKNKVSQVMREFREGKLRTPDGKRVTSQKQAMAIALSEEQEMAKGDYPGHPFRGNQWTGGKPGRGTKSGRKSGGKKSGGAKRKGAPSRPESLKGKRKGSKADRAYEEGKRAATSGKVDVDQVDPDNVDEFLKAFHEVVQQMKKDDKEAKNFNLCKITIPGTNLFCGSNKGIERNDMPQIGGEPVKGSKADKLPKDDEGKVDGTAQFVDALAKAGVSVEEKKKPAAKLKATQNELVGAKVASMTSSTGWDPGKKPIFVSKDGYVLDGHHRWAAVIGKDANDGNLGDRTMNVIEIDMPIKELLDFSNQWAKDFGIKPKSAVPSQ